MRVRSSILAICILAALITFAGGCKKIKPEQDNPGGQDNPENPVTPDNPPVGDYFSLVSIYDSNKEADTFYISGYEAGHHSILVKTNMQADRIVLTSDASWCTPTYDGDMLRINFEQFGEKYEILQPRVCTVDVKAQEVYHNTITLVQQSHHLKLGTFNYQNNFYLPASGDAIDIKIDTNLWDWQIENSTGWITAEHIDRNTLRVAATPKTGGSSEKRSGMIYLYSITEKVFDTYTEGSAYRLYLYDADPQISGDGYGYGDHIDWD